MLPQEKERSVLISINISILIAFTRCPTYCSSTILSAHLSIRPITYLSISNPTAIIEREYEGKRKSGDERMMIKSWLFRFFSPHPPNSTKRREKEYIGLKTL